MSERDTIEAILRGVQDIKIELAKHIVHQEQQRKEIDALNLEVKTLVGNQNKAVGLLTVGGFSATAFFAWLFKNI